jgi:signal recognition particle receptor subunit beta
VNTVLKLNHSFQSTDSPLKIIFVGSVGSGKTTALSTISETPLLSTEAKATELDALHRKLTTTVGLEFGTTHVSGTKIHLYGTPGQRRFDFLVNIACKNASGMVILIDNAHEQPLVELDYFLQLHNDFLKKHPAIIGITHYDDNNTRTHLIEYHNHVRTHDLPSAVMRLDAREKVQVGKLIHKLYDEIIRYKTSVKVA